jgi:hypothetical protein
VEVSTLSGKAIITGFCCTLNTFNAAPEMKRRGWEATIPLIHHNALEAYDSVMKVKREANIIIALHDPVFARKEQIS